MNSRNSAAVMAAAYFFRKFSAAAKISADPDIRRRLESLDQCRRAICVRPPGLTLRCATHNRHPNSHPS